MKILQVNFSDYANGGGGAIAMYRLYQGLKQAGVDCQILCGHKTLNCSDSIRIPRTVKLESQIRRITGKLGLNDIHCLSTFNIKHMEVYLKANILNFHIIHSGIFNYLAIPAITRDKPAVYTLHDMWSFTGHCAYSYNCERWKIGCGKCPYPDTYPAIQRDNTHLEWKLKHWVYNRSNLTIVTPSQWLTEQAKHSMLNRFSIHYIPNGIDTQAYQPLDSEQCKFLLGIPVGKKVLMFAAASLKDPRKGGDLLRNALSSLPASLKSELVLLTIGYGAEVITQLTDIATINLGYVSSDRLKSIVYSAADLFVFPTYADNLPLVLQESLACGTPMVSFEVGGVPDLVRPNVTGYLAKPKDYKGLCQGIIQLLEDKILREKMRKNCRDIALKEYQIKIQVKCYISLYQKILNV